MNKELGRAFSRLVQSVSEFVDSQGGETGRGEEKTRLLSLSMFLNSIDRKPSSEARRRGYGAEDIKDILERIEDEETREYFRKISEGKDKADIIVPSTLCHFDSEDFRQCRMELYGYLRRQGKKRVIDKGMMKIVKEELKIKDGESFYYPDKANVLDILDIVGDSRPVIYFDSHGMDIQTKLFLLSMGYCIKRMEEGEKARKALIITDKDEIYESFERVLPLLDLSGITAVILPHKFFIDKKYQEQKLKLIEDGIITMEKYFPSIEMSITLLGDYV